MPEASPRSVHETALDGLRGIAVLIVVLRSTFNALPLPVGLRESLFQSPIAPLLNAQGAIQLYFVLSAFVLAMSLARRPDLSALPAFWVKRLLRIQPAYMAALLLAWLASFFYVATPLGQGATEWLVRAAQVHLTPQQLVTSLFLTGSAYDQLTLGSTLRVELVFALLIPGLLLLSRYVHWVALMVLSFIALSLGPEWRVLWYGYDFVLGILLFQNRETITRSIASLPTSVTILLFVASIAVFASPMLLGWARPALETLVVGFNPRSILYMGAGALGILACVLSLPALARGLSIGPLRSVGRVSLSLFLVHRIVLVLLGPLVSSPATWWNAALILVLVLGVSLAVAEGLYRLVEAPAITLGRRIAASIYGARPSTSTGN